MQQYPFHEWIHFFANQGVPEETIILLLMMPLIATIVAFFRQVIGIKAFGIYTPSIITVAFLAVGIKYGIAIYITVIAVGMITRTITKNLRILYLPRVAITITIVSLATLGTLVIGGSLQRTGLATVSIFPLLIIITLVEKFVATQIEKGTKTALLLAGETLLIALTSFFIVRWPFIIQMIALYPWSILLTIPINILLGKWTGLRVSELLRFREILKER